MKRTYMVPGVGEINPEAAADTLFVFLWAGAATALFKLEPEYVELLFSADWPILLVALAFSLVAAKMIVYVPLTYYGLIWRDENDTLQTKQ